MADVQQPQQQQSARRAAVQIQAVASSGTRPLQMSSNVADPGATSGSSPVTVQVGSTFVQPQQQQQPAARTTSTPQSPSPAPSSSPVVIIRPNVAAATPTSPPSTSTIYIAPSSPPPPVQVTTATGAASPGVRSSTILISSGSTAQAAAQQQQQPQYLPQQAVAPVSNPVPMQVSGGSAQPIQVASVPPAPVAYNPIPIRPEPVPPPSFEHTNTSCIISTNSKTQQQYQPVAVNQDAVVATKQREVITLRATTAVEPVPVVKPVAAGPPPLKPGDILSSADPVWVCGFLLAVVLVAFAWMAGEGELPISWLLGSVVVASLAAFVKFRL